MICFLFVCGKGARETPNRIVLCPFNLPSPQVKAAMNEINAAQRLRLAAYEQSEAEKIRVVKAAEADAEAK
jgi:hypothetical protein